MLLGCIADDITGATDLALMLARSGMRTVQVMGVPGPDAPLAEYDAVVVALKSRTNPVAEAIDWSLESADALLAAGARQIFFKYCSTFDSTDEGNIGPVGEALMKKLGADIAIVCPAFPANGRSIYQGHLFVGDVLLSDSPMKDHPLTPMRDANLVRVLARQTTLPVKLVAFTDVDKGAEAIRAAFARTAGDGPRFIVTDAITNEHLMHLGAAVADHKLLTGGSGVAMGLAANFIAAGLMTATPPAATITARPGRQAILAGSCSAATRSQVARAIESGIPAVKLSPAAIATGTETADQVLAWAAAQPNDAPVLIYSSDDPDVVREVQAKFGRAEAGALVERMMGEIARGLVAGGCTRLIVAGGETSGAVTDALGIRAIEIGPEIAPGVPWVRTRDDRELVCAFKSGNFGGPDFFVSAWRLLA